MLKDVNKHFGEPTTVVFILVISIIYIAINMSVSRLATLIEGRVRAKSKTVAGLGDEGKPLGPAGGATAASIRANRGTGDDSMHRGN